MTPIWLRWIGRRRDETATLRDRLVQEVAQALEDAVPYIDAELVHRQAEAVADAMLPVLEAEVAEQTARAEAPERRVRELEARLRGGRVSGRWVVAVAVAAVVAAVRWWLRSDLEHEQDYRAIRDEWLTP